MDTFGHPKTGVSDVNSSHSFFCGHFGTGQTCLFGTACATSYALDDYHQMTHAPHAWAREQKAVPFN